MQILIVGKGAKEYALAKYIKRTAPDSIVFVAPGNQAIGNFATCVDIQGDNVEELVDFARANEVNLTIISDDSAIEAGLSDALNDAGLAVFAPEREAARFATSKAVGKKFMYKLKIPTPKFGIYDKELSAREYIKNASYPILIKTDKHDAGERVYLCHSQREASNVLNKMFAIESPKVVIENYIPGREFSLYAITDGYNALPVCTVVPYKYAGEKDGGSITKGVGAYAPANFINRELINKILDTVIYPALNEIEKNSSLYVGIIGADIILDNSNNIHVIEFNTFFKEPDIECVLELFDENITDVFNAATTGSLCDDYKVLGIKDKSALSTVLTKIPQHLFDDEQSVVTGLENIDEDINVTLYNAVNKNNEIRVKPGRALSLCVCAATLSSAKKILNENIPAIEFKGKRFRKDITANEND